MNMIRYCVLVLCFVAVFATAAMASFRLEIYAEDTLDGQPGYLMESVEDGITDDFFVFEEADQVRIFAVRPAGETEWIYLTPGTYLGPAIGDEIGASWIFLPDDYGESTCTLEDFESIAVPAGTFNTAECVVRPDVEPDAIAEIMSFAENVGLVQEYWPSDGVKDVLTDYNIAGGSGYFPLAVGNWWEYDESVVAVSQLTTPANILYPCAPNPFNPATEVSFEMTAAGHARVEVYDIAGRLVISLVDGHRAAGRHQVIWDGRDSTGRMAVSGEYLCRFEAGRMVQSRGMTLIK